MATIPDKVKQIALVHAQLINAVVMTCHNPLMMVNLEPELKKAELNGWTDLIKRIRKILKGERNTSLLIGLDEEDAAIILSILVGLQNPSELPQASQIEQSTFAPQTLAKLIDSALNGDIQSKTLLSHMRSQMLLTPGDMGNLAKVLDLLLQGIFDVTDVSRNMDADGKKLVEGILDELGKLRQN